MKRPRRCTSRGCTTARTLELTQINGEPQGTKTVARVQNLFRATKKRLPMEELPEVQAITDAGFEGCAHARPASKRQVLLMDRETLEAMALRPGIIRENITTDGLNVNSLQIGQHFRVVQARLVVNSVFT